MNVAGKRLAGWVVIDIDATLITTRSTKDGAAVTFKKTFGHHPLAAWCANTAESLAIRKTRTPPACGTGRSAATREGQERAEPVAAFPAAAWIGQRVQGFGQADKGAVGQRNASTVRQQRGSRLRHRILVDCCLTASLISRQLIPAHTAADLHHQVGKAHLERKFSRPSWRKSTFSNNGGNCVEIAPLSDSGVEVRDSKNPGGPALKFARNEWNAFLAGAEAGQFNFG